MKKTLIATIVGTLIIFIYQSMSWMVLPIHKHSFKNTDKQDAILPVLSSNLTEDGLYYLPMLSPETSHEEQEKFMNERMGKPAATISYQAAMSYNMVNNICLGLLFSLIAVWIIVTILVKAESVFNTFGSRMGVTVALAILTVSRTYLMEWNWMNSPMQYISGQITDEIVSCLLLGFWLGWYLGRTPKAA